jgi:hypothetical protein
MVKCSECGFLAIRNAETRNLEEVEFKPRQSGDIGKLGVQRYVLIPVCFAMVANFDEEIEELRKSPEYTEKRNGYGQVTWPQWSTFVKVVLNKERECESFTRWHQGFTPKEHREMLDRQEMLKWQADREDADRKWRTRQRWYMVIIAGIFTILGGVIALLARGCS